MICIGFLSQLKLFSPEISTVTVIASLAFFDRYVVELLFVLIFGIWLINGIRFFRIVCYIIVFLFIAIYAIQLASYYQGGEYISRLLIENINHISLLINTSSIAGLIFLMVIFGCLPFIIEKKCRKLSSQNSLFVISAVIILLGAVLHLSPAWLPETIQKQRKTYYIKSNLTRTPPVRAMYKTLFKKSDAILATKLSKYELKVVGKLGFNLNQKNRYPLIKDRIYKGPPPFNKISDNHKKPNIIVFFTEGFSARTINYYGSKYPDLTPNIDDFAKCSMVVHKYYNHTVSTYRGLHGQLCSLYPTYGGIGGWHTNYKSIPKPDYLSLNHILDNHGYKTIFLDSHRKDEAFVDEMMRHLGFDQVWTAETLSKAFLNSAEPLRNDSLSDVQLYNSLIGFLKKRSATALKKEPFFIGLYNLGTHTLQNISRDGKKYNDGKNLSLNTIHTLDYSFGKFWWYYQNSQYSKNTIVIFTADHCHYQEKAFVAAFDEPGYQRIFVDRVPLIIHDPTRKLPQTFDANYATSVDFTPSLIHYLGLPNHKNPFIGTSIFSGNRKNWGIASFNNKYFLIDSKKIHRLGFSEVHREKLKLIKKFIATSQQIEVENRLWDLNLNKEIARF